jgi:hypothetical protein
LREPSASLGLYRVERCWLRLLLIVVIVSPLLTAAGIGGTPCGLTVFLVIFGSTGMLLIRHELRPAVSLLSSANRGKRRPRA